MLTHQVTTEASASGYEHASTQPSELAWYERERQMQQVLKKTSIALTWIQVRARAKQAWLWAEDTTPDSHYAPTRMLPRFEYQNTITVYYKYELHAYYAYNERSLAYNDYYAYIDLVCIQPYVFLLADLYAKRYVTPDYYA